jgi:hypothetical protein
MEFNRTGSNQSGALTTTALGYFSGQVMEAYSASKSATDQAVVAAGLAKSKDANATLVKNNEISAGLERFKLTSEAIPTPVKK